ncbi:MAG: hypothetical protein ABSE54_05445, partial [Smithella sp.]
MRRRKLLIAVTAMHYDRRKQMDTSFLLNATCLARNRACQSGQNGTGGNPSLTIKASKHTNNRSLSSS